MPRSGILVLVALLVMACAGCTAPAYSESQFRHKAAVTASDSVSAIEVVRLSVLETARHDLFQNPIDVAISDAEDNISAVAGTFSLVQPPDHNMVVLRHKVLELVTDAQSQLERARIAFRQRRMTTALEAVSAAHKDAQQLDRIATRY